MKIFEYKVEKLSLSPDEAEMMRMGLGSDGFIDHVNNLVVTLANQLGEEGWELCYPASVPVVWFKRVKNNV